MGRVELRFEGSLRDHAATSVERAFVVPGTIMDLIESCGVPHPEVGRIEVNGAPADPSYRYRDGDRAAVYPATAPAADPRFVLDVHVGRLAAYLRMLGFDTFYRSCFEDAEIAGVAADERRILLTRDRGLLKRGNVAEGYWLRETDSRRQAAEIVRRYGLRDGLRPFTRCMACNAELVDVAKARILDRLPLRTAQFHDEFRRCPQCGRVYRKGSHYRRMQQWIEELSGRPPASRE